MAHDLRRDRESRVMRKPLVLVLALAGVVLAFLKRQRDRELDEAIWEEPRDL